MVLELFFLSYYPNIFLIRPTFDQNIESIDKGSRTKILLGQDSTHGQFLVGVQLFLIHSFSVAKPVVISRLKIQSALLLT